jgi:hypothetical protein
MLRGCRPDRVNCLHSFAPGVEIHVIADDCDSASREDGGQSLFDTRIDAQSIPSVLLEPICGVTMIALRKGSNLDAAQSQ